MYLYTVNNILSYNHNGMKNNGTFGLIDNLTLSYNGNQLAEVTEAASDYNATGTFEYKGANGSGYLYDSNGALIADRSRGIAYISYDSNGNPSCIYFTNGYMTKYTYSATGQKLAVEHSVAQPNVTWAFGVKPDISQHQAIFAGHTDYLLGGTLTVKEGTTRMLLFDGGYAKADRIDYTTYDYTLFYYTQDHLGNNREVLNNQGYVQQKTDYYPFGGIIADTSYDQDVQPYKYNGKELDLVHGLNTYDYGARQYNPITARWDRVDPLCEKYYSMSPYNYCGNNPINSIDIDGEDNYTISNSGRILLSKKTDDHFDVLMLSSNPNTRIQLQDQSILKQLSIIRRSDYNGGQYGTMNNFAESAKLFKFVADNTDVEWGFDAFRESKGKIIYQIRTSNGRDYISTHFTGKNRCDLIYILHSHPQKNGNDYASGDFGSGRTFSNYSTEDSDYDTFIRINGKIQNTCGKSHPLPHFFLYNARTKNFFEYDFNRSSIGKSKIRTYKELINNIKKRL